MSDDGSDDLIRRAIGGDATAITTITSDAGSEVATLLVMAALLQHDVTRLDRARTVAVTTRDRQTVEIARAHLDGRVELVDALARDHLADHPSDLIVAWLAGGAEAGVGRPPTADSPNALS